MTLLLKHAFQSAKSDGADTTVVQPSNWNENHVMTCASGVVLGRLTAGNGPVEELTSAQAAAALGVVRKAGDTMTGPLTLPGNPTSALQAAPKQYVDTFTPTTRQVISGAGLSGGGNLTTDRTLSIANGGVTQAMLAQPFTGKTAVSASGANVDFTSIPAWVQRIEIAFLQVALTANAYPIIRLGTSGGFVTTGYSSMSTYVTPAALMSGQPASDGLLINNAGLSGYIVTGIATLLNITGNTWVMAFTGFADAGGVTSTIAGSGRIALAGELTQVRITNNGATTFSGGTINLFYQ